jgi:hypothetical protein
LVTKNVDRVGEYGKLFGGKTSLKSHDWPEPGFHCDNGTRRQLVAANFSRIRVTG